MRNFWRVLAVLFTLAPTASIAQIPGGGGGSGGNVNVTQWVGTNLAAPTAWGTAPAGGSIVPNFNVNCVVGCSGSGGSTNITQTAGTSINATIAATGALPIDAQTTSNIYGAITAPVPCKAAATWNASTGLTGTNPAGCDGSAALWMDLGALNGVALGSPSNYGTSPGAVSVQGVNAFVTNSPTTNGASNVTANDCSGTVVTGGTAVNAFTAQTTLHGFTIANYDTAHNDEVLWVSFTTTAAASTAGSYPLPAPTATTFAGFGSFTTPAGFGLNHALSVVAATSGHAFSCTWW